MTFRVGAHADPSCEFRNCDAPPTRYQNSDDIGVKYITKKYFIHPKFKRENSLVNYDFCLVQTTKPMTLDGKIAKAIKISKSSQNITDKKCIVAGWGQTENGKPSKYLKAVNVMKRTNEKFHNLCRKGQKAAWFCAFGDNIKGVEKGKSN